MSEFFTWIVVIAIIGCLFALLHLLGTNPKEGFEAVQLQTDLLKQLQQATSTPMTQSTPLSAEGQKIVNMLKQNTATNAVSPGTALSTKGNVADQADTSKSSPSPADIAFPNISPADQQGQLARTYLSSYTPEPKIIIVPVPSTDSRGSKPDYVPSSCEKRKKSCECPPKPCDSPKKACNLPKWEAGMPVPDYCPKMPDMKDYIRKDSIPCWGCKL